VGYVFEDLHRGRSTIPPHPVLSKPALSRWDVRRPLSVDNCVVLSAADLKVLDAAGGIGDRVEWWSGNGNEAADAGGAAVAGAVVSDVVRRRQAEAREYIAHLF
jgi:hypothetical protein